MVMNNSQLQWQYVTICNFCKSKRNRPYLESCKPAWYNKEPLRIVQCKACELAYASPRPDAPSLYENYIIGNESAIEVLERKLNRPNVMKHHRKSVEDAVSYLGYQPKYLYDMGCGAGTIMLAAKELGIEVYGNDVNKACTDWLQEQGLHARFGFTQDLPLPDKHMDIVMNLDYIEHTYTPMEDLKKCFQMLKPGGVLYLKTLYLGCPDHVEKGDGWQLFGIGHFYYFTPKVLVKMISKAGFEIIEVKKKKLITIIARRPIRNLWLIGSLNRWYQRHTLLRNKEVSRVITLHLQDRFFKIAILVRQYIKLTLRRLCKYSFSTLKGKAAKLLSKYNCRQ